MNENLLAGSTVDGTYQKRQRNKNGGGKEGCREKTLPNGRLKGEAVVGILRQTNSSSILSRAIGSSNTMFSLQQLHCSVQDSLKLPVDCSHFRRKLWGGGGAVWLVGWWALYFWVLWFKPKLQPKERQRERGGWFLPWWQSLPLERAMPTLLEYNIPLTSRRALRPQEIMMPLHNFHGAKSIVHPFLCRAAEDKECFVCLYYKNHPIFQPKQGTPVTAHREDRLL